MSLRCLQFARPSFDAKLRVASVLPAPLVAGCVVAGALGLMAALSGCKKAAEPGNEAPLTPMIASEPAPALSYRAPLPAAAGSGSAQVTYRPNAHVVEQEEGRKAIRGISSDGIAFLLDADNPKLRSLAAGDTLVIKGLLAKKILGAEIQGDSVLVITQPATLPDILQQGHIAFSAPVRFHSSHARNDAPSFGGRLMDSLMPAVYAYDAGGSAPVLASIKGANVKGWTTDFTATPGEGRTDIQLTMTKSLSGLKAVISGDGYVSDFDFDSDIGVDGGSYQNVSAGLKNLNGVMNFHWEAGTDTPGVHNGDDRIKLPAVLGIPLYRYLDGLPLYLEISSALIIKPAFSGGREFSRGSFRITYDGYQHFSAKQGNMDTNGNVTGDIQFLESQNISFAPMGMVVAFAAPRLELSLGFNHVVDMSDLKTAASVVDKLADTLEKKLLSAEQYDAIKNSLGGQISLGTAVENATKTDAAAYFEMVSSVGMSNSGVSSITPCTRHDIHLWGKVGVSAEAFGQQLGKSVVDVYQKDFTRVDPPGTRLCEEVGQQN